MRKLPSPSAVAALAGISAATVVLPRLAGWPHGDRTIELLALTLAATLTPFLGVEAHAAKDRTIMAPSFILTFVAVLMFGPHVAMLVAATSALSAAFLLSDDGSPSPHALISGAGPALAAQAAGQTFQSLSMAFSDVVNVWPWHGALVATAVVVYVLLHGALAEFAVPVVTRQKPSRSWVQNPFRGCSVHLVGATVAAALVELIDERLWELLPVVAGSLFFAYQTYADYVNRLEEEHHRREVLAFLEDGMSVVGRDARITVWNSALGRMLDCSRERAMGQAVDLAVPALGRTELPKAIKDTLGDGRPRLITNITVPSSRGDRSLEVKVLPVADGVTLLWHDFTERLHAQDLVKQNGERLALAAEGANDGLWQWDLRTHEFYVSGRWRAMIGLSPNATVGRPEDWLDRVHQDDIRGLKETLKIYLAGRTDVFQYEHRIRHQDGTYRRFLCRGLALKGQRTGDRIAGSLTDTTEQAIAQERLRSVGFLDPLTGLFNRAVFVEGLGRRLEEFKLGRVGNQFAVLYLDLDRFKVINDSLGHLVGDELLIAASRRLETCLRHGDALARLGGDEFAILLNGLGDDGQANAIAFRIQDALSAPFSIGGREVFTSASIGIAFGPAHYTNPDEVMRDADTAMYHAKARGKARHEVFDADMHARVRDRLSLENDLRRAIATNDFDVHYQPIVSLTSGMCVGFESLVRWTRNGEPIPPSTFIPIAEELGLVGTLGTWVMQQACLTFAEWQRRFPGAGLDYITVNISSRQLMQQNFVREVQQAVTDARLNPPDLRVEITETALMDSPSEAADVLRELRDFGVKVYLDDFGTGYSSLSHLHKLPVDALKIDRSFVRSLLLPDRPAIVESILALARTLNTSVVAEGIEDDVQARELERLGCTHAQGFLFSRPLPTSSAEALVKAHLPLGPKGAAAQARLAMARH